MANWNRLMEAADAAPSILNTKPWLFRSCDYDRIELYADWDQRLEVIDPRHRELFISCGAALFNVRIAIRVTGDDPLVSLAPDERNNGAAVCPHCGARSLLASVELGEPGRTHPVTLTEQALYEAIPRRHTVREPFTHRIQMSVLVALEEAARMEGVDARLLHRSETRRLRRLIAGVDKELKRDPPYLAELEHWTGNGCPPGRGVPPARFGPKPRFQRRPPVRDLGLAWQGPRQVTRFEKSPQLITLATVADSPSDWMRIGQALQRLLLTATYYRVETSFLTQLCEAKYRNSTYQFAPQSWPWPKSMHMIIRIGKR